MKKLRLLLFEDCERNCAGCCNKDWDLSKLPRIEKHEYAQYDIVSITGGEPMLDPNKVIETAIDIGMNSNALIYLYTAKALPVGMLTVTLAYIDGVCFTIHEQHDVSQFLVLNDKLDYLRLDEKSMRLNIFKGIDIGKNDISKWKVKRDIEWIKNCPLPQDEVFMRL